MAMFKRHEEEAVLSMLMAAARPHGLGVAFLGETPYSRLMEASVYLASEGPEAPDRYVKVLAYDAGMSVHGWDIILEPEFRDLGPEDMHEDGRFCMGWANKERLATAADRCFARAAEMLREDGAG